MLLFEDKRKIPYEANLYQKMNQILGPQNTKKADTFRGSCLCPTPHPPPPNSRWHVCCIFEETTRCARNRTLLLFMFHDWWLMLMPGQRVTSSFFGADISLCMCVVLLPFPVWIYFLLCIQTCDLLPTPFTWWPPAATLHPPCTKKVALSSPSTGARTRVSSLFDDQGLCVWEDALNVQFIFMPVSLGCSTRLLFKK